jgi:hypothetical protein
MAGIAIGMESPTTRASAISTKNAFLFTSLLLSYCFCVYALHKP